MDELNLEQFSDNNTRAALARAMDEHPALFAGGMDDVAIAVTAVTSLKRLRGVILLAEVETARIIARLAENNLWTAYPGADQYDDLYQMLAVELELDSSDTAFFRFLHEQLFPMLSQLDPEHHSIGNLTSIKRMAALLRQFTGMPQRRAPSEHVQQLAEEIREEARQKLLAEGRATDEKSVNDMAMLITLEKSHDQGETNQVVAQMYGGGQLVPLYAQIHKHQDVDHDTGEISERYSFGYVDLSAEELARVIRANRPIASIPHGEWT